MADSFTRHETYEGYAIAIRARRETETEGWELRVDVLNPDGVRCAPSNHLHDVRGETEADVAEAGFERARQIVYEVQQYGLEHLTRPPAED